MMGLVCVHVSSLNAHNSPNGMCVVDQVDKKIETQRGYMGCLEGSHC